MTRMGINMFYFELITTMPVIYSPTLTKVSDVRNRISYLKSIYSHLLIHQSGHLCHTNIYNDCFMILGKISSLELMEYVTHGSKTNFTWKMLFT